MASDGRAAAVEAGLMRPERALGQSEANYNVESAAAQLARVFRKQQGLPATVCEEIEMNGDNARAYFNRYCRFLSCRAIPKNFKDNLEPKNPSNKAYLTTKTLVLYIGNHLMHIRRKIPNHPDWLNDKPPIWWTDMRTAFTKECDKFQQKQTGDFVFGMADNTPLYRCVNDPPIPLGNLEFPIDDYVSAIDMRYILRKLAKESSSTVATKSETEHLSNKE